jgi:hypothetical protein
VVGRDPTLPLEMHQRAKPPCPEAWRFGSPLKTE